MRNRRETGNEKRGLCPATTKADPVQGVHPGSKTGLPTAQPPTPCGGRALEVASTRTRAFGLCARLAGGLAFGRGRLLQHEAVRTMRSAAVMAMAKPAPAVVDLLGISHHLRYSFCAGSGWTAAIATSRPRYCTAQPMPRQDSHCFLKICAQLPAADGLRFVASRRHKSGLQRQAAVKQRHFLSFNGDRQGAWALALADLRKRVRLTVTFSKRSESGGMGR